MIKIEIKRLLKRPQFYVVILIGILIGMLDFISNNTIKLSGTDFSINSYGVYSRLMLYNINEFVRILQLIMPLIVTIAFADSYLEDVSSGFIKNIIVRYDKKKYLLNRFIVNFVVSGLIISIPFIINYILYAAFIPSIEPKIYFSGIIDTYGFLPNIYYNYPFLYVCIRILLLFVYGGTFSSIALASSIFIKNRYVVTLIPLITYISMDVIIQMSISYRYSPMVFLFLPLSHNFMYLLIPLIFIPSCFCVFMIGGKKNELL